VRGNISTSGRFYVGISSNPSARIAEHRRGEGAEWTRRYPPCGVAKLKLASRDKGRARLEEDATVKRLMRKHGKENVRGGSYSRVQLTSTDNKALSKELNHAEGGCLRCGHQGHWASQCYAQRDVEGRSISSDGDTFDDDDNHAWGGCFRCGHQGHWASQCYAQRNVEGRSISSNGETFDDDDDDDAFDDDDEEEEEEEEDEDDDEEEEDEDDDDAFYDVDDDAFDDDDDADAFDDVDDDAFDDDVIEF